MLTDGIVTEIDWGMHYHEHKIFDYVGLAWVEMLICFHYYCDSSLAKFRTGQLPKKIIIRTGL